MHAQVDKIFVFDANNDDNTAVYITTRCNKNWNIYHSECCKYPGRTIAIEIDLKTVFVPTSTGCYDHISHS